MFPLSALLPFVGGTTSKAANEAAKCVLANSYEVTSPARHTHRKFNNIPNVPLCVGNLNSGKTESRAALERDSEHTTRPAFKAAWMIISGPVADSRAVSWTS